MSHIIEDNVSAWVSSLFLILFSNNNVELFFPFELIARSVVIVAKRLFWNDTLCGRAKHKDSYRNVKVDLINIQN